MTDQDDQKNDQKKGTTPGQPDPKEADTTREGMGMVRDEGVPGELREEMFENARLYRMHENTEMTNVNDEPGFQDGMPGSISDFSVVTGDGPEDSTARLADPNDDAGGEVSGPRVGGAGGFDGGPQRGHKLKGEE